jgi:hypothetical protein
MADFQQFYNLDMEALLDAGEYRRARILAQELPQQSRTVGAIDPRTAWGTADYLLALVVDHLAFLRYEHAGGKGRKPKPTERPKAKAPKVQKRLSMPEEKRASLLFAKRK